MTKLNPYINKKERSIESLTETNKKKEAKIEELKSKMPSTRGRPRKSDTKAIKNIEKRKKLKREIDKNKEKIRQYKAQIKELVDYKNTIKKIFHAKTLKTAMKYYHASYDKIEELPPIIQDFIKKLSKKIDKVLHFLKDKKNTKNKQFSRITLQSNIP